MVLGKIGPHRWDWSSVGSNLFSYLTKSGSAVVGLAFGLYCAGVTWSGEARWKDCVDRDGVVVFSLAAWYVCFALSDPLTVDLKQLEHDSNLAVYA